MKTNALYDLTDHEITLIVVALTGQADRLRLYGDVSELRNLEAKLREERRQHHNLLVRMYKTPPDRWEFKYDGTDIFERIEWTDREQIPDMQASLLLECPMETLPYYRRKHFTIVRDGRAVYKSDNSFYALLPSRAANAIRSR